MLQAVHKGQVQSDKSHSQRVCYLFTVILWLEYIDMLEL